MAAMTSSFRRSSVAFLVAIGTLALVANVARADWFDDKDFSLRFPAALSRFASYADVAGVGGASAGSFWSSSINPASLAWRETPGKLHMSFSPQYSGILFHRDIKLHVVSESLTWNTGECGVFQPSLAQARSNEETTRQGLDFSFEMDYGQLQWAKKVSDSWAFGAGFNLASSETRFDLGPLDVSKSLSETYGFRFGALHQPAPGWLAGAVFDYAFSPARTTFYDFLGLGIGDVRVKDTTHQYLFRPGLSYEYKKDSAVYADYQLAAFDNDTGRLLANRFYLGVDHGISKGLFVRGGVALDTKGSASWSCGVGIYPSDSVSIDLAYQNSMFPELKPDFGSAHTLTLSLSISF